MQAHTNPGSIHRPGPILVGPMMVWALCACMGLISSSWADDADPASRVARISYLKGPVYVQTADDKAWSDAGINLPLTNGDQLWTDSQGRSELQMGSTTIQVDANTQLRIAELNDDELQLVVTQGVVNVRVRHLENNDRVEIDTPNAAVTPVDSGTYRIEVAEHDDSTVVQVREGKAQVAGEKQDFTLRENEQLSLRGTQHLTAEFDELARMDEFDRWAQDRNDRAERVASSRYVAADVIGYEDLDDYGYWHRDSDYGYVWMPTRIVADWAPYRYGHWGWVSPWGWTWIDDAPWGFAPFHYGRWAMLNRRWCWVPGPRSARAVYAPALVAWVGTPGVSVSVNIGHRPVGWIPLGPREVYRPYYRGSYAYVTRVNLSNSLLNSHDFERGYRRQPHDDEHRNRSAASVVQTDTLRTARPVNNHLIRSDHKQLQPLASQPVARAERDESSNHSRQFVPPVAPNTRGVVTRRDFGGRDVSNRNSERNEGSINNAGSDMPGNVRSNDPNRWRGNRDSDNVVGAGRGADPRNDDRATDDRNRDGVRDSGRIRHGDDAGGPTNRDSRSIITTPSTRPEMPPQRDRSINPPATDRGPDVAPRIRREQGIRDEMHLGRRETNGAVNNRQTAPTERQRDVRAPNNPAPVRNAPAPVQSAPMAPAASSRPEANRPQRGRDNQQRGRGGDVR